jgi:hypothetical protein
MKRLFQHYLGSIDAIVGAEFSVVKELADKSDGNIILMWFQDTHGACWYRIYIDGVYCGVDRYEEEEISDDMDEYVVALDHSGWFKNKRLTEAIVESDLNPDSLICMSFKFNDGSTMLLDCVSEDGECRLHFKDKERPE